LGYTLQFKNHGGVEFQQPVLIPARDGKSRFMSSPEHQRGSSHLGQSDEQQQDELMPDAEGSKQADAQSTVQSQTVFDPALFNEGINVDPGEQTRLRGSSEMPTVEGDDFPPGFDPCLLM
jgi:hypothetical protein